MYSKKRFIFVAIVLCLLCISSCTFTAEHPAEFQSSAPFVSKLTSEATSQPNSDPLTFIYVYITDTGECYHRIDCGYLYASSHEVSLEYALSHGYRPCSRCNPP